MSLKIFRTTIGPLLLIVCCPAIVMLLWYTNTALEGSLTRLSQLIFQQGFFFTLYQIGWPICFGTAVAWKIIASFVVFQYLLVRFLPGKIFHGPVSPKGNIPIYKNNGILSFLITIVSFCLLTFYWHLFPATLIYDNFGAILGALNILSLVVCLLLYLKGRFLPSSSDAGISGNFIFDFYWGTELYPKIGSVHLKMFINCRIGMMSWFLILLSFAAKQTELYGLSNAMIVAVALQFIYIAKFFIWETGYLASLDIMHDRAGFYICWGCLVWVPGFYTSPTLYLIHHPNQLSLAAAILLFIVGATCILINYFADRQRQLVRAKEGDCKVWGKKPKVILASYTTDTGIKKQTFLLSSGWWGITRHFHYLPEIAGAFFWSVPALFDQITPYLYVLFLTVLLLERAFRDDRRCKRKYGHDWDAYCKLVPYKIIPYIV